MERPDRLDVFFGDEIVGTVHDASPLAFEYSAAWLARPERFALAAIPLQPGRNDTAAVRAFFGNLLPEGELRDYIAAQRKASTLFSMLFEVAGDTAGAFVILPAGETPRPASYQPTTWARLAAMLNDKSIAAIDIEADGARISLAGAQDKTSIAIFDDGAPMLPKGTSPATHILKPDIKRLSKVWGSACASAANEAIIMLAAARCGLPTADVFYEPSTRSCIVRRFDRIARPDGTLARVVQYDLCQLAGVVSDVKYEKEGGPGVAACGNLIRKYCSTPAVDLRHFIGWLFFNLYVGNNDSHAKNLSLYWRPGHGVLLTPFYDLMCTRIYPGLSQQFALSIGGEVRPGSINREHVEAMARALRVRPEFAIEVAKDMANKMPDALMQAMAEVKPSLSRGARTLAVRLQEFVLGTTRKMAARIL